MVKRTFASIVLGAALLLAIGCSSGQPDSSSSGESFDDGAASDIAALEKDSLSSSAASISPKSETSSRSVDRDQLDQLSAEIGGIAEASGMDLGVSIIDLETGAVGGYRGSEQMVSASMVKMLIAAAFLERVHVGEFSLDDPYTLQASDIVGGTGTLGGLGAGASVTYRDILEKMIYVSDNTGANILIDAAGGMSAVNAEAEKLGLESTQLNRYMMDEEAASAGIENYTSADDLATLFEMAYDGTFVDAESSAVVLRALEQQEDYGGVLGGLPGGVSFAHKTGTLATVRHDGGIVEGESPYVVVVLCGGDGYYEQGALDAMAQVGAASYSAIAG